MLFGGDGAVADAVATNQKRMQRRHHPKTARHTPLSARLAKRYSSETSSKRASGANINAGSQCFFFFSTVITMTILRVYSIGQDLAR